MHQGAFRAAFSVYVASKDLKGDSVCMDEIPIAPEQETEIDEPVGKEAVPAEKKPEVKNDPLLMNFKLSVVNVVIMKLYSEKSAHAYLKKLAERDHILDDGRVLHFGLKTFEGWVRNYRKSGMNVSSLETHVRSDKGASRKLPPFVINRISEYLQASPKSTAAEVLQQLEEENLIVVGLVSEETIRRLIKTNHLRPAVGTEDERIHHPFIMDNVGDMWQADTCYGNSVLSMDEDGTIQAEMYSASTAETEEKVDALVDMLLDVSESMIKRFAHCEARFDACFEAIEGIRKDVQMLIGMDPMVSGMKNLG